MIDKILGILGPKGDRTRNAVILVGILEALKQFFAGQVLEGVNFVQAPALFNWLIGIVSVLGGLAFIDKPVFKRDAVAPKP